MEGGESMWNIKAKWKHMDLLPALGIDKNNIETTTTAENKQKNLNSIVFLL